MKTLIIYGSQYGTTERYAVKFAEMTDFPAVSYEDVNTLTDCERVIYFGGLYAGGVKGLKSTVKKLPPGAKLVIVTVGLADVCDEKKYQQYQRFHKKAGAGPAVGEGGHLSFAGRNRLPEAEL